MDEEHPLSDDICPFCNSWRVTCRGGGEKYTSYFCLDCKKSYDRNDITSIIEEKQDARHSK